MRRIKLRAKPKYEMSFRYKFIHLFQPETETFIKILERILIKLYRHNVSLLFNQTYLNERLLPNYTYFKIHDPAVHHDTNTQKYRCSLVKRQINYNKEKINTLNTEAHNVSKKLKNSLSTQFLQTVEQKLSYIIEKKSVSTYFGDEGPIYIYIYIYWTRLFAFHIAPIFLGKVWIQLFPRQLWDK